jgi:hypothetical protein
MGFSSSDCEARISAAVGMRGPSSRKTSRDNCFNSGLSKPMSGASEIHAGRLFGGFAEAGSAEAGTCDQPRQPLASSTTMESLSAVSLSRFWRWESTPERALASWFDTDST